MADRSFLIDDLRRAAGDVALALTQSGYRADFSPRSLWEIDRFLDDVGDRAAEALRNPRGNGHALFALGGYVGEVIRRSQGGIWHGDDDDPQGEVDVSLVLRDGSSLWPVQRVLKRFQDGPEDSLVAYGVGLGLDVGEPPPPPTARTRFAAAARHDPSPSVTRRVQRWWHDRHR